MTKCHNGCIESSVMQGADGMAEGEMKTLFLYKRNDRLITSCLDTKMSFQKVLRGQL